MTTNPLTLVQGTITINVYATPVGGKHTVRITLLADAGTTVLEYLRIDDTRLELSLECMRRCPVEALAGVIRAAHPVQSEYAPFNTFCQEVIKAMQLG